METHLRKTHDIDIVLPRGMGMEEEGTSRACFNNYECQRSLKRFMDPEFKYHINQQSYPQIKYHCFGGSTSHNAHPNSAKWLGLSLLRDEDYTDASQGVFTRMDISRFCNCACK